MPEKKDIPIHLEQLVILSTGEVYGKAKLRGVVAAYVEPPRIHPRRIAPMWVSRRQGWKEVQVPVMQTHVENADVNASFRIAHVGVVTLNQMAYRSSADRDALGGNTLPI